MECVRVGNPIRLLLIASFLLTAAFSTAVAQPQYQPTRNASQATPNSVLRYAFKSIHDLETSPEKRFPRLAGEFEPQKAILLSVSDLMYQHNGVLTQIVEKTSGRVPLIILFNDQKQLKSTVKLLDSLDCDLSHVSLYNLKLDTIWLRDFGPRIVETSRGTMSMDFFYDGQRPLDDKFPLTWGKLANAEINKVKWTLHGGNLISNGKGLAIASSRLFEDNRIAFPNPTPRMNVEFERRKIVVDAFKKDCNINQLLILEPVQPEATKHVDMFATFLAADQILLAEVDPRVDPANARLLDYNAQLLKQVKVEGKPLRVERIRIPPRQGKYWSPYTNIIFANELVLMPVYKTDPPEIVRNAISTYRRLLPGVHVETVDMTTMQKLEGALHCMSINVPQFADLPSGVMSFAESREKVGAGKYVSKDRASSDLSSSAKDNRAVASNTPKPSAANPSKVDDRKGDAALKNAKAISGQVAAAQTYRRTFVDQSRKFSLDAFAIGIVDGAVILIRKDSQEEVKVDIQYLCKEDKIWLSKNRDKIRSNGAKVRDFVEKNNF
jgi:agmatine/peptidylarginine deiminase